jgi:hypothetical protein
LQLIFHITGTALFHQCTTIKYLTDRNAEVKYITVYVLENTQQGFLKIDFFIMRAVVAVLQCGE